ncbi:MAG TPA: hypothetical protein VFS35_03770 [Terrimicrobiaceae bacterium]|nr:hypothetical protein [Terrimicrobiaceae bacterium]
MGYAGQFKVAALARAEALPFFLEDKGARPAFLEVEKFSRIFGAQQRTFHA